jgi:protein-disulfide isomerase
VQWSTWEFLRRALCPQCVRRLFLLESIAAAIGLVASCVLAADYASSSSLVCGLQGGCAEVESSAYAALIGIPTPWFGVLFFAVSAALLATGRRSRFSHLWMATGALAGFTFIALQAFVIAAWCKFCVAADISAIFLGVVHLLAQRRRSELSTRYRAVVLPTVGVLAVGLASLILWPSTKSSRSPEAGPQSAATIVEFMDFQCPGCRKLHSLLREVASEVSEPITIERKHVPLPRHAHAMDAARAFCCAEEQELPAEKLEQLADVFFSSSDLSPEACQEQALLLGVDATRYQKCVNGRDVDARIAGDGKEARARGLRGLPTFFVKGKRFEGVPDKQHLLAALRSPRTQ